MIPTLTRVVAKDEQQFVENKQAYEMAPHSNDFTESSHATFAQLSDRLPGANPLHTSQIAQYKQNSGTARALGIPLVRYEVVKKFQGQQRAPACRSGLGRGARGELESKNTDEAEGRVNG